MGLGPRMWTLSMAQTRFLIVGGGNMATAIVGGAVRAGFATDRFVVADPNPEARTRIDALGVRTVADPAAMVGEARGDDQVLLAVKPQMLDAVAPGLAAAVGDRVVISILAGTPTARIRGAMGGRARVVRAMPNTPARVGVACTAIAEGAGASPGDGAAAREVFGAIGVVVDLQEDLFDAFTAVAGSGPAYVFLLAEAMIAGAVRAGLPPDVADRAVRQTILGAARIASEGTEGPDRLRAAVTSKGGTTEAALDTLFARGWDAAMSDAIVAARDRGRALSP